MLRDLYLSDMEEIIERISVKKRGEFEVVDLIDVLGCCGSHVGLGTVDLFGVIDIVLSEVEEWARGWKVKPLGVFGEIRDGEAVCLSLPAVQIFTESRGSLARAKGRDDLMVILTWIDMVAQAFRERSPRVKVLVDLTKEDSCET